MLQDLMCSCGEHSSEITHKINLTSTVLWIELRIRPLSNSLRFTYLENILIQIKNLIKLQMYIQSSKHIQIL